MSPLQQDKKAAGDLSRDQDRAEPGPDEAQATDKSAEDLEAETEADRNPAGPSVSKATEVLERESEPLQRGETLDSPLGPLPRRSLVGMALMVAIGAACYLIAWTLLGTVGLLLGWIPAVALGMLAAREYGRRAEA